MVSRTKRSSYVTESDSSSDEEYNYYPANKHMKLNGHKNNIHQDFKVKKEFLEGPNQEMSKRKCTTKNAVMARENRKRKKMYIQNLEDEVTTLREEKGKLSSILDNQSFVISELRKEIKYMKSILANSSDIGNLIKNIRCSTGMSVTTSLDKTLTLNNDCVSKHKLNLSRKTAHPWEDRPEETHPIPEGSLQSLSPISDSSADFDISNVFNDLDLPLDINIPISDFQFDLDENASTLIETPKESTSYTSYQSTLNDHNYTSVFASNYVGNDDDVGVCLHVSKHRVSLEFCSSCSDSAIQTWKEME